ncbi:uncharacterized protein [Haliotis asinina]|uniref:uncharacterized protein n=1 Tax=Haliotis asinina TaxID=109174 RepID=UPI0035324B7A
MTTVAPKEQYPGKLFSTLKYKSAKEKKTHTSVSPYTIMVQEGRYSFDTGKIQTFGVADYTITAAMLVASAAIGVFYVIKDRHHSNVNEYLLGGRRMHYIPVSMSMMVTYLSALSLLGAPVEVYRMTGFNLWGIVIVLGSVSTLYTVMGGMKAVLWADTLQAGIIIVGCIVLVIKGSAAVGGFSVAWAIAENRSRIKFDEISFDPTTTYSVWAYIFGFGTLWMGSYGVSQPEVQRTLSCSTLRTAQIALGINAVGYMLVYILLVTVGVIMFAFYSDCHPVSFNIIDKNDQLLPLMVMDILGDLPGLPGLFISAILCGSLSTISSVLNALGVVIPDDVIKPFCLKHLDPFSPMYRLSYLYFTLVSISVASVVGSIVSFVSGPVKPKSLDPRLICPLFDKLFPFLPERVLKPLRFGINHEGKTHPIMEVEGRYSIDTGKIRTFGVADYTITVTMLVASAAIGIFYIIKDRHHSNVNEYLLGGRRMHYIPVSMSMMVTYLSALSFLGAPVEVYRSNTMVIWNGASLAFGCVIVSRTFLPFFYQLGITNVFQGFYTSVVLYAPSIAVSAVTGFNLWGIVIVLGLVSTLYTAMGGMKAVLWADTLQAGIIIVGCIVLVIKGSAAVGGFSVAWAIAENRSRIKFDEALGINAVGYTLVYILLVMVGVIMFAFYSDCHPVSFNIIDKDDQLLPLMVMDILGDLPGLPGLFISAILCGSLRDPFSPMYRLSYLYYSLVATVVVGVVGSIVSLLTGSVKPESLDPRLICPLFDKLFPFLPERVLKPLRFGIDHEGFLEMRFDKQVRTTVLVPFLIAMGGMKAVLWTDTLQGSIMIIGCIALVIKGSAAVGGFSVAWAIAENRSRIKFDEYGGVEY